MNTRPTWKALAKQYSVEREHNAMQALAYQAERDEWKAKYIQQNKDLGCEMSDPNGTIWDYAKKVQSEIITVTEQRDRLADLVKQFIYILDITEESDGGRLFHPTNITSCRAGDLQKAGELVEALRRASRNQPTEL